MHEVLVNRLGGLSLPRKSVVRLTDRPDMTLDVYRGGKTIQYNNLPIKSKLTAYFELREFNFILRLSIVIEQVSDLYPVRLWSILVDMVNLAAFQGDDS